MLRRVLRTDASEILDDEGASERGLRILADVERWNRVCGWTRWHLKAVEQHYEALGRPRPFRVLDVGAGIGGMLLDIAEWAEANDVEVDLYGVDHNPEFVERARERLGDRATLFVGDATRLDCGLHAYHLATCTLMMHHLDGIDRNLLIKELARACRSVYLFDLSLTLHGVVGATIIPRLAGMGADAVHDGIISVRKAATFQEFQDLVAPLPVRAVRVFPTAMCTLPEEHRRIRIWKLKRGRLEEPAQVQWAVPAPGKVATNA